MGSNSPNLTRRLVLTRLSDALKQQELVQHQICAAMQYVIDEGDRPALYPSSEELLRYYVASGQGVIAIATLIINHTEETASEDRMRAKLALRKVEEGAARWGIDCAYLVQVD